MRIFVTDDLPGLEEAFRKIFPEANWQLCVLHSVRDALNQARKKDREALAEDLKCVYRAETEDEAKEALKKLHERWGTAYPRIVRPRLTLFLRFFGILGQSAGTCTPRTNWSGWRKR